MRNIFRASFFLQHDASHKNSSRIFACVVLLILPGAPETSGAQRDHTRRIYKPAVCSPCGRKIHIRSCVVRNCVMRRCTYIVGTFESATPLAACQRRPVVQRSDTSCINIFTKLCSRACARAISCQMRESIFARERA